MDNSYLAGVGDLSRLPIELRQQVMTWLDDGRLWASKNVSPAFANEIQTVIRLRYRAQIRRMFGDAVQAFHETLPITPQAAGRFKIPPAYDRRTDGITRIIEIDEIERFRYVVQLGLDIRAYSRDGWRLLGLAISFHAQHIIDFLIERLPVNDLLGPAHAGIHAPTYLTIAALSWNVRAFERITEQFGGDTHAEQLALLPPQAIYDICLTFPAELLEIECQMGLDLQLSFDMEHGGTAWHAGVRNQNQNFLDVLQHRVPGSVDDMDHDGHTPLFWAVEIEAVSAASMATTAWKLIETGADVNYATAVGLTALHIALSVPEGNTEEMLRILLDGFDVDFGAGNIPGTILHSLVIGLRDSIFSPGLPGQLTRLPFLSREYERDLRASAVRRCRLILEYEPDLGLMDAAGQTALELAEAFGFEELAVLLRR
ncbi:ANK [Aspergillus sp. HF37]|nr:ANK [Aspergillus sp. HF37]